MYVSIILKDLNKPPLRDLHFILCALPVDNVRRTCTDNPNTRVVSVHMCFGQTGSRSVRKALDIRPYGSFYLARYINTAKQVDFDAKIQLTYNCASPCVYRRPWQGTGPSAHFNSTAVKVF